MLTQVRAEDAGNYVLVASNSAGQVSSPPITLNLQFAPVIAADPRLRSVGLAGNICLQARVSGAKPLSYHWRLNGADLSVDPRITGGNSSILCLTSANYGDMGAYTLTVSNAFGSATADVALLSVSPVVAWGDNTFGQTALPIGTTNIVAIAAGENHSLALREDGTVVAWGDDS